MKALTARQQAMWDSKEAGRSNKEIADGLGISINNVSKTLTIIRAKLGIKGKIGGGTGIEDKSPVIAAAAMEAASDPAADSMKAAIDRVNEQLKAAGVPGKVSAALVRRMTVKFANGVTATKELRTNDILEILGNRIDLAASYLDDKVMAEASARDLMLGLGVLIEKRNLLRGEPTAIISDHDRKKVHELLPMLYAEAKRRSLTVEGEVTSVTVSPA